MNKRRILAAALLVLAPAPNTAAKPVQGVERPVQLTTEKWRKDLAFMAAEMKRRHPNLYHSVSREAFYAAVADLNARIPTLQRNQVIVGMMRIAAMVGDGHTRVDPREDARFGFPSLPLRLYLFDDGLFVRAAQPSQAQLVGAEILEIGGVPVDEALRRVATISSRDNAMAPKLFAPLYLDMPDILQALDLSSSRTAATFKLRKGGRTWTATIPVGDVDPLWPDDTDISLMTPTGWVDARGTGEPPMWLADPLDHHRLVELPERHALYAQLNMVANEDGETLSDFGKAIADRARVVNPKAIVLDLRLDQGGNGDLRTDFVRELIRAEDEDTLLFVLTARGTFSASQFILDDLDRLSKAVFIGEPASSKPSSFGDAYYTRLPNSGIGIRTSIKWWQAGQNFGPWTYMDVSVPLRFADYAAGRDPALEAALSYEPQPFLADVLLKSTGAAQTRSLINSYLGQTRNRYANAELYLLFAARRLAAAKRFDEALIVAEVATERFPNSTDAHMIHSYVAEQGGKLDIAVAEARRALEVDPNNRNGRELLDRLTKAARP